MIRRLLLVTATAATLGAIPATASADYTAPRDCAGVISPVEYEDDYCWNWTVDGNGHRGVVLKGGKREVVDTCRYAFLSWNKRIDTKRTPKLRGDFMAKRHGCDETMFG